MAGHRVRTDRIPANIRTELRRAIALRCCSLVFERDDMTVMDQVAHIEDAFHGNERKGIISENDFLCHGEGPYEPLYSLDIDYDQLPPTDKGALDPASDTRKQLRHFFSRSPVCLVTGVHITPEVMAAVHFNNDAVVTGRNLYDLGKSALRDVKKAHARLMKIVDEGGKHRESGNYQPEDIANQLLDDMWEQHLNAGSSEDEPVTVDEEDDADDDEVESAPTVANAGGKSPVGKENSPPGYVGPPQDGTETAAGKALQEKAGKTKTGKALQEKTVSALKQKKRPDNWFFPGFIALFLFGPTAEEKHQLNFLNMKDPPKGRRGQHGRAAARKRAAAEAAEEKKRNEEKSSAVAASSSFKKKSELLRLATLDLQSERVQYEMKETEISVMSREVGVLREQVDRAFQMGKITGDFSRYTSLEIQLDHMRKALFDKREEVSACIEERCKQGPKRAYDLTGEKPDEPKQRKIDQRDDGGSDHTNTSLPTSIGVPTPPPVVPGVTQQTLPSSSPISGVDED